MFRITHKGLMCYHSLGTTLLLFRHFLLSSSNNKHVLLLCLACVRFYHSTIKDSLFHHDQTKKKFFKKASLELFANKWSDTDSWEPLFLFYCYKLFRFKRCVYSIFKFELFVPTYVKTFILTNSQLWQLVLPCHFLLKCLY
jgi:hypothetical protein